MDDTQSDVTREEAKQQTANTEHIPYFSDRVKVRIFHDLKFFMSLAEILVVNATHTTETRVVLFLFVSISRKKIHLYFRYSQFDLLLLPLAPILYGCYLILR